MVDVQGDGDPNSLRQKLATLAANPDASFGEILNLATELSKTDPDHLRFSVSAKHISRLGLELVAKQETAVAELIKNSYDADATSVDLAFSGETEVGGTLEIWDNGHGMDRDALVSGFMRLSTADKESSAESPRFGRPRAGRKGIGRFAAQRLGTHLMLETQVEGAKDAQRLEIDWAKYDADTELGLIENHVEQIPPLRRTGTRLTIGGLRDAWSTASIRKAQKAVQSLLQPFPLGKAPASSRKDPGFHVDIGRETEGDLDFVANPWAEHLDAATATVDAWVDDGGEPRIRLTSATFDIDEESVLDLTARAELPQKGETLTSNFECLRRVKLRVYYFHDRETPRGSRGAIKAMLREFGGVRVYRNGFRVFPYGERLDDWLQLDESARRRQVLPPHSNVNFLGFVAIDDPKGHFFEETSSREGLLENDSFRKLQVFAAKAIFSMVLRIAEAREKKPLNKPRELFKLLPTAEEIVALLDSATRERSHETDEPYERVALPEDVREGILRLGQTNEALLKELAMMRVLAALGITIGEFTHEVAFGFDAVEADARNLLRLTKDVPGAERIGSRMVQNVELVRSFVDYFEATVRKTAQRRVEVVDVQDVFAQFKKLLAPHVSRRDVELTCRAEGRELYLRPMNPSELMSILTNLCTNSMKAIKRKRVQGKILVRSKKVGRNIEIDFLDNGDGIPKENRIRVFDAFFTTTPPSAGGAGDDELSSMGLGLKIAKDTAESLGGTISVEDPPEGFSCLFRIRIPAARDDEVSLNVC